MLLFAPLLCPYQYPVLSCPNLGLGACLFISPTFLNLTVYLKKACAIFWFSICSVSLQYKDFLHCCYHMHFYCASLELLWPRSGTQSCRRKGVIDCVYHSECQRRFKMVCCLFLNNVPGFFPLCVFCKQCNIVVCSKPMMVRFRMVPGITAHCGVCKENQN